MAELIKVNAPVRKPLFEGVQGENEARSIQFDITPWVEGFGSPLFHYSTNTQTTLNK